MYKLNPKDATFSNDFFNNYSKKVASFLFRMILNYKTFKKIVVKPKINVYLYIVEYKTILILDFVIHTP